MLVEPAAIRDNPLIVLPNETERVKAILRDAVRKWYTGNDALKVARLS